MKNLTMMTDLYQLTMMSGYFKNKLADKCAVFDLFFRQHGNISYAVFAGLEQAVDYVKNLRFSKEDIAYLKGLGIFEQDFLDYLQDFKFCGDIYSVKEGTVVFPDEPIMIVKGRLIEAQLIESALLNIINHQTLIATKASYICEQAYPQQIVEFGLRRAHAPDAAINGSRAAIIGGCVGTSNVLSAQMFDLIAKGTHAHSWVMAFDSELDAFRAYAKSFPDACLLLVDTFDTLKSGVPNAITVFKELARAGHKPVGIRIDSGDLAYLSKKARQMLDESGFMDAIIMVSGDIDEHLILSLRSQGAKIDAYGVGTRLVTGEKIGSLGGVYKLSALEHEQQLVPKMKVSDSAIKATNPGFKQLLRVYVQGKAFADLIALQGESFTKPLTLTHPIERWKQTTLHEFELEPLLHTIFLQGQLVYDLPSIHEICDYARTQKQAFWDEYKRLDNPHIYKVDLSDELFRLKQDMLKKFKS